MRLDRYVSAITGLSRKDVKAALGKGRVRVDGAVQKQSALQIDERAARVELDGQRLVFELNTHIMLNKPAGVLTATEDRAQKTVLDLLPDELRAKGLTPIGRLDKDTTGLLLLTTDGQLAHRLISPRHHVEKEYIAHVDGALEESDIAAFERGMALSDFTALPAELTIIAPDVARVILREGKYHQVKRMLAACGKPVTELMRARMGAIKLDPALAPGEARKLTASEIEALYLSAGLEGER